MPEPAAGSHDLRPGLAPRRSDILSTAGIAALDADPVLAGVETKDT